MNFLLLFQVLSFSFKSFSFYFNFFHTFSHRPFLFCSQMLTDGGTAVDAAIATLLCEGVILTHSMGIGGGFVATIYKKSTRKIETLIARESAPAAATKDMFVGQSSVTGECENFPNYPCPNKKLIQPLLIFTH